MRRLLPFLLLLACADVEPDAGTGIVATGDSGPEDYDPPGPSTCSPIQSSCADGEVCAMTESGWAFHCEPSGGAQWFEECQVDTDCSDGLVCLPDYTLHYERACEKWCSLGSGAPCPSDCEPHPASVAEDLSLGACRP